MRIFIFSRPVHSGKTSALLEWCGSRKNVAGIAMPDVNGLRKIMDLETKQVFDIECADPENTGASLTSVGRFHFYTDAFERANAIVMDALSRDPDWMVIDEAGKIELERKGFYEALKKAVAYYSDPDTKGRLLITIRDSLCFEMISFLNIRNFSVIYSLDELE
jgi:nucleoside-triphosphatase THEP1